MSAPDNYIATQLQSLQASAKSANPDNHSDYAIRLSAYHHALQFAFERGDLVPCDALRKRVMRAIFDPGATEGFKGDRDLTTWQTDAVMRALATREGSE